MILVQVKGLEPSRISPLVPKANVSTIPPHLRSGDAKSRSWMPSNDDTRVLIVRVYHFSPHPQVLSY